ncbi:MAG: 30S ribosome-binding factor RbfA [Planctomycetota bacterium]
MANPRTKARLEARILERAAHCIEFELNDPRASFLTLTRVELTDDLYTARLFYSVYGSEGDKSKVAHMLEDATGFVRKRVAGVLRVRRAPRLVWLYDDSVEYAAKMDQTIRDALERDREINPGAHPDVDLTEPEVDNESQVDAEYLDFLNAKEEEEEGGGEAPKA